MTLTDVGGPDQSASATLANADHRLDLVGRYVDADNYVLFRADGASGLAELWVREAGDWLPRLTATLTPISSGDRFDFVLLGTALTGLRNGQPVVGAVDGHFRDATACGFAVDDPDAVTGFLAVALPDGPPPPTPVKLGPVPAYYPFDRYANDG